jgi:hypothetical protein
MAVQGMGKTVFYYPVYRLGDRKAGCLSLLSLT